MSKRQCEVCGHGTARIADSCWEAQQRMQRAEAQAAESARERLRLCSKIDAAEQDAARLAERLALHNMWGGGCDLWDEGDAAALAAHEARVKGGAP